MLIAPTVEDVRDRLIEASEMDRRGLLRPLLLYKGGFTEGRLRAMWNVIVSMKDAGVPSVTEAVKLSRASEDYRHVCGVHAKSVQNGSFNGMLSRLRSTPKVSSLIPGLQEYVDQLAHSTGAFCYTLDPISEFALRVRSDRTWRLQEKKPKSVPTEFYPYISGPATSEHDMLMAVDAIVPKGLSDDVRADVCQDMIVAVLSGDVSIDNLRGDLKKYLGQFWKMFPGKYGHISLDAAVPGTSDMRWDNKLSAKHSRLVTG